METFSEREDTFLVNDKEHDHPYLYRSLERENCDDYGTKTSPEKMRLDVMVYPRKTSAHVGVKRIKFTRPNLIFVPFEIPFTLVWLQLKLKTIYQTAIRMLENINFRA